MIQLPPKHHGLSLKKQMELDNLFSKMTPEERSKVIKQAAKIYRNRQRRQREQREAMRSKVNKS